MLALLVAGCDDTDASTTGTCRRLLTVIDDVSAGKIRSGGELQSRLRHVGTFHSGSQLRDSLDRLQADIAKSDERGAAIETNYLTATCQDVLNR